MILGRKSTLFLAYAYQFEVAANAHFLSEGDRAAKDDTSTFNWKRRRIEGAALLPHLDDYVRKGELLRAYDVASDLRGAFGPKDRWTLTDGKRTVDVHVTEPPRIYTFDTRYLFVVIGVTPASSLGGAPPASPRSDTSLTDVSSPNVESAPDRQASSGPRPSKRPRGKVEEPDLLLAHMEDAAYYVVRAGVSKVKAVPVQMQRWLEANKLTSSLEDGSPMSLRRWLAQLVPGLPAEAPRGTPRTQAPAMFSVVLSPDKLPEDDLHRLRLMHRSDQQVEPGSSTLDDEHGVWRCSQNELVMFSSFGFSWVVEGFSSSKFLSDAPHMIRDRYVHKWLIVEHQRLCLLALATECADMSRGLDGANFAVMRMRLLTFIAKYNFRHISNEERHDRFYMRAQQALSIEDLLAEVREEVVEIDTQLSARRGDMLNHVLAFLTLVLTPVGIIIGVFQGDTIPFKFELGMVLSASAWFRLFSHGPFIVVLVAMILGVIVYVRLFGFDVVLQLVRAFFARRQRPRDPEIS